MKLSNLTQPLISDHQHCIGGYQGLTSQPGLLCFCQRSLKSSAVGDTVTPEITTFSVHLMLKPFSLISACP